MEGQSDRERVYLLRDLEERARQEFNVIRGKRGNRNRTYVRGDVVVLSGRTYLRVIHGDETGNDRRNHDVEL